MERRHSAPLARVSALLGDTATGPDAGPTVGSRVTFFVGNAVRNAAADLREAVDDTVGRALGDPVAGRKLSALTSADFAAETSNTSTGTSLL